MSHRVPSRRSLTLNRHPLTEHWGLLALGLAVALATVALPTAVHAQMSPPLTKYLDPLPIPGVMVPTGTSQGRTQYAVELRQVEQTLHSQLPPTTVWTYNGTYPGATFEARRGEIVEVTWTSILPDRHILPVDRTLPDTEHGEPEVRTVVHRHGGLQDAVDDGVPDAWFTPNFTEVGPEYVTNTFTYPNNQPAATLWYHDHAAGMTRLNVYAGLAGFYLVRDAQEDALNLPKGRYEIPIVIQDRTFKNDGSGDLYYPSVGSNPRQHPVWVKMFMGDTVVVNGKVWPYLNVEPRKYRFRFLNGSNARRWDMRLSTGQPFIQIGTDIGLMARPQNNRGIRIDPGERADVVIDFKNYPGQTVILRNNDESRMLTEIMAFRVSATPVTDTSQVPSVLRAPDPINTFGATVRDLTLEELDYQLGRAFLIDGKFRMDGITEVAQAGSVEVWRIANLLSDTHPMHLHLSHFQVLDRQPFDSAGFSFALQEYRAGRAPKPVFDDYLYGTVTPAKSTERGNKDTVQAKSDSVVRLAVQFAEYTGDTVWHCHILEHEDNDMMRPLRVEP